MAIQKDEGPSGSHTSPAKRWVGKIQVLEVHLLNSGNVRAFVRVQIGTSLVVRGVKVIQQPNQRAYVRLPDQQNQQGRWFPIVESVDEGLTAELTQVVLAAWEDALAETQARAGMEGETWPA